MSALDFMYYVAYSAEAGPRTMAQFLAPTNQRVLLKEIELMPQGATGATVPLDFELVVQDGAGTSSDDSSALQKHGPVASETVQTTVRKSFTSTEPATNTKKHPFQLHQQGARTWRPLNPIVIEGGTRLGLRYLSSLTVAVNVAFHLEE